MPYDCFLPDLARSTYKWSWETRLLSPRLGPDYKIKPPSDYGPTINRVCGDRRPVAFQPEASCK